MINFYLFSKLFFKYNHFPVIPVTPRKFLSLHLLSTDSLLKSSFVSNNLLSNLLSSTLLGNKIMSITSPTLHKSKSKTGLEMMKTYLLKKAENMYKLNLSDEEAFKWKFNKNKKNRPLSSFRLIRKDTSQLQ